MLPTPVLPDDYYLTNFKLVLEFVYGKYKKLLTNQEYLFIDGFYQLSEDAQKLLTRCFMRKGELFRLDKLNYAEIKQKDCAVDELLSFGFIQNYNWEQSTCWLSLFSKPELIELFARPEWKSLKRTELDAVITDFIDEVPLTVEFKDYQVIKVPQENFDVCRLLFFGSLNRDLTEFVLQDLGLMNYESYAISEVNLPIQTREQLEALIVCHRVSESIDKVQNWTIDTVIVLLEQLPIAVEGSLVKRRTLRLVNRLARELERLQAFELAAKWYARSTRPPARERRIRCLEKLGEYQQAWHELQHMKQESLPQQEQVFVQVFEKKLGKKIDAIVTPSKLALPKEELLVLASPSGCVERDVVNDLCDKERNGGGVWWCENALFNMIFALAYWDLIFADVDGAFYNPFQMVPADMYEPEFLLRRKTIYEKLEKEVAQDRSFRELLVSNYQAKYGKACLYANWSSVDETLLNLALDRIPLEHLRLCNHRILQDPKEHRSGLPDLIHFPEEGGYQLIEVKGPGDRLQSNQKMWMDFFARNEIPHRLIRVEYSQGSKVEFSE